MDPAYEYAEGIGSRVRIGERSRTRRFAKRDQFAAELEYFSQCMLDSRTPEPSGAEGLADVRIIEAIGSSARYPATTVITAALAPLGSRAKDDPEM